MKNANWAEIRVVAGCGAAGGLLAWLIAATNSGLTSGWWLSLCAAIGGGAAAAGAGVYLLANTDTSHFARLVFFSVFCGVCWQPIFKSAKTLVNSATVDKSLASARDTVDRSIPTVGDGSAPADILAFAEGTAELAEKLPAASNPELRQEGIETIEKAVAQIQKLAVKKPDEATAALEIIGKRAAASGSVAARLTARDALMNVRDKTGDRNAWERADKAIQMLK
jgi:hypothetical protein